MVKIQSRIILEILGRPKDYVKDSLIELINRLSTEKGLLIMEKKLHDPVPVKDSKDLFTSFAEIIFEVDSIMTYFGILFAYMPANIEVIYPENISLNNLDFNELSARLVQRLHDYDAIAKKLIMEKNILENKLREVAPQMLNSSQLSPANNSFKEKKAKTKNLKKPRKK